MPATRQASQILAVEIIGFLLMIALFVGQRIPRSPELDFRKWAPGELA